MRHESVIASAVSSRSTQTGYGTYEPILCGSSQLGISSSRAVDKSGAASGSWNRNRVPHPSLVPLNVEQVRSQHGLDDPWGQVDMFSSEVKGHTARCEWHSDAYFRQHLIMNAFR